ncbi:dienelactone hydrolase family protein [Shewanella algae]|uniref:dienelactone hydrolase family protein n=1 Tax=Shewanella algae TaxID=38313 RepID=UPI001AAD2729|nr:dienelactone hydrolase family protein [Shewanella algae]MBO2579407.1 dienelactone hydrolase family protein [Shewanella algae]MBO2684860.1 dienelactone hydrolase family protein [Shewanella algae]BCV64097.1 carboxymethylenebutenolidase [Shewanella algae]
MLVTQSLHQLPTASGSMQTRVYRPDSEGCFPAIIFYSEIFQETAPISRMACMLAGHGFVVLVPEIFHELNPPGTVLGYDDSGKDKGNSDKLRKPLEAHDDDTQALVDFIRAQPWSRGRIGAMGVCVGGHLAFRAALNPDIAAAFCLYATDIHSGAIPSAPGNDSLSRCRDIRAELMMIWGKQDPHVPSEGRCLIQQRLEQCQTLYSWQELNAQHAFMRDGDPRYDPALALQMYQQALALFQRRLN